MEAGFFMGVRTMSDLFMHRAKRGPDILRLASQVIENLRGTPFVMALLVINIIVLAGFAFTCTKLAMPLSDAMPSSRPVSTGHDDDQAPPLTYINRVSRFYRPSHRAGWSGHISRGPSE
jgi:hypothetical protein